MDEKKTPLLDQLEEGQWPSFVTQLKQAAQKSPMVEGLVQQLEASYEEKIGHWKHGGIVGVKGYGGGVVGRYTDDAERFPGCKEFHTMRVNQTAGFFYSTDKLRQLADVWDKHGTGLFNLHGSTGDIILLGCDTANIQPCFDALGEIGFDLGGSGGALRTPSCCVGMARCEKACIDSMDITHEITMHFQNEMHRPAWPYKFKIKVSACPNDCAAATARSDMAVIGVWRDTLVIDQDAVREYVDNGFKLEENVIRRCPTWALNWDSENKELKLKAEDCTHCMHCINAMPKAIHIGKERGAAIMIGGKAPVVKGANIGWVLVPFMKMEAPYDEFKELVYKVTDFFAEHGKNRERVGELIDRLGYANFLKAIGLEPVPQMVAAPRANPYIFWSAEEVEKRG